MKDKTRLWQVIILILHVCLSITLVGAIDAPFDFDPVPPIMFNLSEDISWWYDVNVTCEESSVNFSLEEHPYSNLTINPQTGVMEFTPTNDEVGWSNYYILITKNKSSKLYFDTTSISWNISNTNDAPNITSFYPTETNTSVKENSTLEFNYTASDDDAIHGDLLNASWSLNGTLVSTNATWNYTPGFCDAGLYNVTLVVNDTSNAKDTQSWNVTVNNTNREPILNYTVENRTWQEDTNLTNNLTLDNFFSDLDNLGCSEESNLTFSAVGNSSITVTINASTTNVSFIPTDNFFGVEIIYFTANDGTNTTKSNNITFNVTGVNDAPTFNYSNQTLYENVIFVYEINASDPDNEFQQDTDTLTYYDNSTLFNISSATGIINFIPGDSDAGYYPVNISVDDGTVNTSALVYFNLTENSIPVLSAIGNKNATEGTYFRMNVSATDADNDTLTFSSNFSGFGSFAINSTAVNFSFLPDNDDVGNHTINITVTETSGASDYELINLTVFNINNPPNLTTILNQTLRTDKLFTLFIPATDPDNDNLTFYDNSSFINITYVNITTSKINFTPTADNAGNHTINISVSDANSNDSQIVLFVINNNTAPDLSTIGNYTFEEDSLFILQINATDNNNDSLSFDHNSTILNFTTVNSTSVMINFTPTQQDVGLHWINFTVNDSPLVDFEVVFFNITFLNDTPYFDYPIPNLSATVAVLFYYDVNATDEENDSLTYSDNSTIFNISNSTGMINFTPTADQIGNYSTNISVSDGLNLNSTIITFQVFNSTAPTITSFTPDAANVSVAEGSSILFNVTASDPNGDAINYSWTLNLVEKSTNQSWLYEPTYTEAGQYNVTIMVSDGSMNDSHSWNLTVNDTNRLPKYGIINQSSQSEFSGGTLYQVNITAESGNITLAKSDGINYFAEGNFTSSVIDMGSNTNITLLNLSWKEDRPENTSVIFQVRSSPDNTAFTNFTGNNTINYTNPNGTLIDTTSDRYVQYRAILSTNNSNTSPTIRYAVIHYKISDFEGREDTVYLNYIDLDDYFSDLDTDNTLSYTASDVSNIEISIDSANRVGLTPDADWYGARYVVFTATDGFSNRSSNNISLTFSNVAEPAGSTTTTTVTSGGGGGGGGGGTVYRSIITNQSKSVELIVPENVYVGINEELIVPITVQNNEDYVMQGIHLRAFTNITDIHLSFTKDYISRLEPNNKTEVELVMRGYNISRFFSVKVFADVTEPEINDSAIISINIMENVSGKISYVRDFIRLNPECLELNELVLQAKEEVENYNYDKASVLLDKAIDNCKFLLSAKKIHVSEPGEFSFYSRIIKNPYFRWILILIIFGISLTIAYAAYNRWKWY